jgi:hypothetical protein
MGSTPRHRDVVGWVACSGSDRTFGDGSPSSGGDNAAEGGSQAGMLSDGGSPTEPMGEGGSASGDAAAGGDAGASSLSGAPAHGGEGGGPNAPACATVYGDWFRATFPYPDGGILGVADFPSSPWRVMSGTTRVPTTSNALPWLATARLLPEEADSLFLSMSIPTTSCSSTSTSTSTARQRSRRCAQVAMRGRSCSARIGTVWSTHLSHKQRCSSATPGSSDLAITEVFVDRYAP